MPVQPMKTKVYFTHPGASAVAEDAPEKEIAKAAKLKGTITEVEMFMIDARDAVARFPDQYSFVDPAEAARVAAGVDQPVLAAPAPPPSPDNAETDEAVEARQTRKKRD